MVDSLEKIIALENAVYEGNLAVVKVLLPQVNVNTQPRLPEKLFCLAIRSGKINVLAYINTNYSTQVPKLNLDGTDLTFAFPALPIDTRKLMISWLDRNRKAELTELSLTTEHLNALQGVYDVTYHDQLDKFGASPFCYYFITSELAALLTLSKQLKERKELLINYRFPAETVVEGANNILIRLSRGVQEVKLLELLLSDDPNFKITSDARFESKVHIEFNISVAWYLVFYKRFDCLRKYIKCQQGLIDLNAGPVHVLHEHCGASLAWLLAKYEQWDLLEEIVNRFPEYPINLNAAPVKFEACTLRELLIRGKQFALLKKLKPLTNKNMEPLYEAVKANDLLKIRYCLSGRYIQPSTANSASKSDDFLDAILTMTTTSSEIIQHEILVKYGVGIEITARKLVERPGIYKLAESLRLLYFKLTLEHLETYRAAYDLSEESIQNVKLAMGQINRASKQQFVKGNLTALEPILTSRYFYLSGIDFIHKGNEHLICYLRESLLSSNDIVKENAYKILSDLISFDRRIIINELLENPKLSNLHVQDKVVIELLLSKRFFLTQVLEKSSWITNANMKLNGEEDILYRILSFYFNQSINPIILLLLKRHKGQLDISYINSNGKTPGASTALLLFQLNDSAINQILLEKLKDVNEKVDLLTASIIDPQIADRMQAASYLASNKQWELLSACLNLMPNENIQLIDLFTIYNKVSLFEQLVENKKWEILHQILKAYVTYKIKYNAFSTLPSGRELTASSLFSSTPFTQLQAEIVRDLVKLLPESSNIGLAICSDAGNPSLLYCCIQQQLWDVIEALLPYYKGNIFLPPTEKTVIFLREYGEGTYNKIIEHNKQYNAGPLEFIIKGDIDNFKRATTLSTANYIKIHYLKHALSRGRLPFVKYLLEDLKTLPVPGQLHYTVYAYICSDVVTRKMMLQYLKEHHGEQLNDIGITEEFIRAAEEEWTVAKPMPFDSQGLTPLHYHILTVKRNKIGNKSALLNDLPEMIEAVPGKKKPVMEGVDFLHFCLNVEGRDDIVEYQYNTIKEITYESIYLSPASADYGISFAFELAKNKFFHLLEKYIEHSRIVIGLNRGPLFAGNIVYGVNLAWLLAKHNQWETLAKLASRDLSYINLFACLIIEKNGLTFKQLLLEADQEALLKLFTDRFHQRIQQDELSRQFLELEREEITNINADLIKFHYCIAKLNPEEKNFKPIPLLLFAIREGGVGIFKLLVTKFQALRTLNGELILDEICKTAINKRWELLEWLLTTERYKEMSGVTNAQLNAALKFTALKQQKEIPLTNSVMLSGLEFTQAAWGEFFQYLKNGLFAKDADAIGHLKSLIEGRRKILLSRAFQAYPELASLDYEELLGDTFRAHFPVMLQLIYNQENQAGLLAHLAVAKLIEGRKKVNCFEPEHLPFIVQLIREKQIALLEKLISLLAEKDEVDLNIEIKLDDEIKNTSLIVEFGHCPHLLKPLMRYHKGEINLPVNINYLKKKNVSFQEIENIILNYNYSLHPQVSKPQDKPDGRLFALIVSQILENDLPSVRECINAKKDKLSNDQKAYLIMIAISRQDLTFVQFLIDTLQVDFSGSAYYKDLVVNLCRIEHEPRRKIALWLLEEKSKEIVNAGISSEHLRVLTGVCSAVSNTLPDRLGLTPAHYVFLTNQAEPTIEEFYEKIKSGAYSGYPLYSVLAGVGQLKQLPAFVDKPFTDEQAASIIKNIPLITWYLAEYKRWDLIKQLLPYYQNDISFLNSSPEPGSRDCGKSVAYMLAEDGQWDLLRYFVKLAEDKAIAINLMAKPIYDNNKPTLRTLLKQGGQEDLLRKLEKTYCKDSNYISSAEFKNLEKGIMQNDQYFVRYYFAKSKLGEFNLEGIIEILSQIISKVSLELLVDLVTTYEMPLGLLKVRNVFIDCCLTHATKMQQYVEWLIAEERYRQVNANSRLESLQAMMGKIPFEQLVQMINASYEDESGYVPLCYFYAVIHQITDRAIIKKANDYLISALEANEEIGFKLLKILVVCQKNKYLIDLMNTKPGLITVNSIFSIKGKQISFFAMLANAKNAELFDYFLQAKTIDLNLISHNEFGNVSSFYSLIDSKWAESFLDACVGYHKGVIDIESCPEQGQLAGIAAAWILAYRQYYSILKEAVNRIKHANLTINVLDSMPTSSEIKIRKCTLTTLLFEQNQYELFFDLWEVTSQVAKIKFISNPVNLKLLIHNYFFDHVGELVKHLASQNTVVNLRLEDKSIDILLHANRLDVAKALFDFLPEDNKARLREALNIKEQPTEKTKQAVQQEVASSKASQAAKLCHAENQANKAEDSIPEEKQPISLLINKRFADKSRVVCTMLTSDDDVEIKLEFKSAASDKESLLNFINLLNKYQIKISKNFPGTAFTLSYKASVIKSLLVNGRFKEDLKRFNRGSKEQVEKNQNDQFLSTLNESIEVLKKDTSRILGLCEKQQGTWEQILRATLGQELEIAWDETNKAFIISLSAKELTVHPYNFDSKKSLVKKYERYQILDDSFIRDELFSRAVAELNEKEKDYGYAEITKEGALRFFPYSAIEGTIFSQLHKNIYARMQKIPSVKRMEVQPVEVGKPKEEVRPVFTVTMLQPLNEKAVKELLEKMAKREFNFLSPCKGSSKKPHILTLGFQYKGREKFSYDNELYDSRLFFSAMRNALNKIVPHLVEVFPSEDAQFNLNEDIIVKIIFRNRIVKDPNNNNLLAGEDAIAYLNAFNDLPTRFERELRMLRTHKEEENDDNLDVVVLKKEKAATSPKVEQGAKLKDTVVILSTRREVNLQFHCERLRQIQKKIAEERAGENNDTKQNIYYLAYFLHLLRLCQQLGCARNNFKDSFYQLRNVIRHDFLRLVKNNSSRAADYADLYARLSPTIEKLNSIFLSEINKAASIRIFAANQPNFQQCIDDFNAQLALFQKQIDQKNLGKMPVARRIDLIKQYAEKILLVTAYSAIGEEDREDAEVMLHILRGSLMPCTLATEIEGQEAELLPPLGNITEEEKNEFEKDMPASDKSRGVYEAFHSNLDTPHAEILAEVRMILLSKSAFTPNCP